jgi:hypothetical protein
LRIRLGGWLPGIYDVQQLDMSAIVPRQGAGTFECFFAVIDTIGDIEKLSGNSLVKYRAGFFIGCHVNLLRKSGWGFIYESAATQPLQELSDVVILSYTRWNANGVPTEAHSMLFCCLQMKKTGAGAIALLSELLDGRVKKLGLQHEVVCFWGMAGCLAGPAEITLTRRP